MVAVPEPGPGPDGGPEHNPDGAVPGPAGGTGRWFAPLDGPAGVSGVGWFPPLAGPDSSAGADADRREPGAASGAGKPAGVLRHDTRGSSDPFGPRPRHAGSEPPGSAPQQQHRESVPGSAAEAIAMTLAGLGFLAHADAASLPAGMQADCLRELERALAVHTAARARVLAAFTAQGGHEQDGQGSPRTWLTWQTRITRPAAAAAAGWTRRLAGHPAVRDALVRGEVSQSWARQICDWTDQLPAGHRDQGDAILLAAAAGGADLPGLAELAGQIRARLAGPDRDRGDGFAGRGLRLATTLGGAGRLTGDLSARCAAALAAVLDALGAKAGPDDTRTRDERNHDALGDACQRLIAARCLPGRAGQPVQLQLHLTLDQLLAGIGTGSGGCQPRPACRRPGREMTATPPSPPSSPAGSTTTSPPASPAASPGSGPKPIPAAAPAATPAAQTTTTARTARTTWASGSGTGTWPRRAPGR